MANLGIRAAKKQDSSAKIIKAAMKVFGENDYTIATLYDVAKEAGLSQGLVSQRFISKENLYIAAMNALCAPIFKGMEGRTIVGIVQVAVQVVKMKNPAFETSQKFFSKFVTATDLPKVIVDEFNKLLNSGKVLRIIQNAMEDGIVIKGYPNERLMSFFKAIVSITDMYNAANLPLPDDDYYYSFILEKNILKDTFALIQEKNSVNISINNDFELICAVSLSKNSVRVLHISKYTKEILGDANIEDMPFAQGMQILNSIIHPDDIKYYNENCKIPIILKALENEIAYYLNFRITFNGETKYTKVKFTRDDNNKDLLIIGIVNIDDEMKSIDAKIQIQKEIELKKEIDNIYESLNIKAGVSKRFIKQFISLTNIDLNNYDDTRIETKTEDGIKFYSIEEYINNEVIEQEREDAKVFLSFDNVKKGLSTSDEITLQFKHISKEGYKYYLFQLNRGKDDNSVELLISDIDENIKIRDEQEKRIKDKEARENSVLRMLSTKYAALYHINLLTKENRVLVLHENFKADTGEVLTKYKTFDEQLMNFIKMAVHEDDRAGFYALFSSFKESLKHQRALSYVFRRKNGNSYLYYKLEIIKVEKIEEETRNILVLFEDIDDEYREELEKQHKLEEAKLAAETASQAKTSFLFNMSHDIRTPMNAIIGFTQKAERNLDNKEILKECLGKVQSSNLYLLKLINDVLDMARIESGKVTIEEKACDVSAKAKEMVELFLNQANEKNITLIKNLDNIKHNKVYADELRVTQIVSNILSNAIKYTKPGGHVVYSITEIEPRKEGFYSYSLSVEDDGIGMTEEYRKTIFDQFTRAQNSTVSGIQGTGLGMAIVKKLVEMMGGIIYVESELGVGTKVSLILDFRKGDGVDIQNSIEEAQVEGNSLEGCKVLLVEDNELNREIACDILTEGGAIVKSAEDGSVAVKMLENATLNDYDIVLMDIQMPYMNGYEATTIIRKMDSEISRIPIIAMTANAFDEDKKKALAAGMDGHVAKPIDIQVLISTIKKFRK